MLPTAVCCFTLPDWPAFDPIFQLLSAALRLLPPPGACLQTCAEWSLAQPFTSFLLLPFCVLQLIYNFPEQLFADAGIMAIEHADFDGIERLALVTGALVARAYCFGLLYTSGLALTALRRWHWSLVRTDTCLKQLCRAAQGLTRGRMWSSHECC